jgi:hypothetical protein
MSSPGFPFELVEVVDTSVCACLDTCVDVVVGTLSRLVDGSAPTLAGRWVGVVVAVGAYTVWHLTSCKLEGIPLHS